MKFSIKDFFNKCDQIRIWSYLQKKSLMENFIFLLSVKNPVRCELGLPESVELVKEDTGVPSFMKQSKILFRKMLS